MLFSLRSQHAHFAFIIHVQTLAQERMGMYGE